MMDLLYRPQPTEHLTGKASSAKLLVSKYIYLQEMLNLHHVKCIYWTISKIFINCNNKYTVSFAQIDNSYFVPPPKKTIKLGQLGKKRKVKIFIRKSKLASFQEFCNSMKKIIAWNNIHKSVAGKIQDLSNFS